MMNNDLRKSPPARRRSSFFSRNLHQTLLFSTLLWVCLLTTPAEAAKLQSWRFDSNQNKLFFTTDTNVQPRSQMVFNPSRLVIDLPGVNLGRRQMEQMIGRGIKSVRVAQFNSNTTRLVVEISDGYQIDPAQIKFQGITARQWVVQLPTPERIGSTPPTSSAPQPAGQLTALDNIEITPEEILFRTSGASPQLDIRRAGDGSYTTIDLRGAKLSPDVENGSYPNDVNGVKNISVNQLESNPPVVRVTLQTDTHSPDWKAEIVSGGVILKPGSSGPVATVPPVNDPPPQPRPAPRPRPNNRIVIVVDPGHGGGDAGAVGWGGLREKDVVLDISRQVASYLEQQGVQAILTRSDDREIDLAPRVQLAERVDATLFVSIHANAISMSRPDVNGLETYYYDDGIGLARSIHNSILQSVDIKNRGVRSANFYVMRETTMPAVLVEVGFVTGSEDAANLANAGHRTKLAQAIARGVMQYLGR